MYEQTTNDKEIKMKKTIIFAGFMGFLLVGVANAADTTTVATVKKVDTAVNTVNAEVVALNNQATTDADTVDTHKGDITDITNNRQVVPSNLTECQNLNTTLYSGCGYISTSGTDGSYTLVKIAK